LFAAPSFAYNALMKIGVCLSSMGLSLRQGLPQAAKLGAAGVQIDSYGDLSPERLTDTGRRELRNLLKTYGLELTALNCPLRHSIDTFENQQLRIEHVSNVMSLAFELGPRLVIVQCPKLPDDAESPRGKLLRDALLALGQHGDRIGSSLALEIGFDSGEAVRGYLATFDVGSLGVNYDPANLMLHGHDPVQNLMPLHGKILHLHARDARKANVSQGAAEVALGAGDIEWLGFIGTLTALDYRGWLVVDRENGDRRLEDIAAGVKFLRRLVV
jgi:L-ribulose-5-phosphate 3-epimerase